MHSSFYITYIYNTGIKSNRQIEVNFNARSKLCHRQSKLIKYNKDRSDFIYFYCSLSILAFVMGVVKGKNNLLIGFKRYNIQISLKIAITRVYVYVRYTQVK